MAERNSAASESAERELVITRVFDAPRRLVFKAWTEPDRLVRWWGPQGFTMPSCRMDLRPGGAFRFCMRSPEGTDHWLQGVYREVVEPERLVCTWAWEDVEVPPTWDTTRTYNPGHETLLTVSFAEHGGKTRLTVHQAVFETVTACDAHQSGWTSGLDRLAEYLAKA